MILKHDWVSFLRCQYSKSLNETSGLWSDMLGFDGKMQKIRDYNLDSFRIENFSREISTSDLELIYDTDSKDTKQELLLGHFQYVYNRLVFRYILELCISVSSFNGSDMIKSFQYYVSLCPREVGKHGCVWMNSDAIGWFEETYLLKGMSINTGNVVSGFFTKDITNKIEAKDLLKIDYYKKRNILMPYGVFIFEYRDNHYNCVLESLLGDSRSPIFWFGEKLPGVLYEYFELDSNEWESLDVTHIHEHNKSVIKTVESHNEVNNFMARQPMIICSNTNSDTDRYTDSVPSDNLVYSPLNLALKCICNVKKVSIDDLKKYFSSDATSLVSVDDKCDDIPQDLIRKYLGDEKFVELISNDLKNTFYNHHIGWEKVKETQFPCMSQLSKIESLKKLYKDILDKANGYTDIKEQIDADSTKIGCSQDSTWNEREIEEEIHQIQTLMDGVVSQTSDDGVSDFNTRKSTFLNAFYSIAKGLQNSSINIDCALTSGEKNRTDYLKKARTGFKESLLELAESLELELQLIGNNSNIWEVLVGCFNTEDGDSTKSTEFEEGQHFKLIDKSAIMKKRRERTMGGYFTRPTEKKKGGRRSCVQDAVINCLTRFNIHFELERQIYKSFPPLHDQDSEALPILESKLLQPYVVFEEVKFDARKGIHLLLRKENLDTGVYLVFARCVNTSKDQKRIYEHHAFVYDSNYKGWFQEKLLRGALIDNWDDGIQGLTSEDIEDERRCNRTLKKWFCNLDVKLKKIFRVNPVPPVEYYGEPNKNDFVYRNKISNALKNRKNMNKAYEKKAIQRKRRHRARGKKRKLDFIEKITNR